MAENTNLKTEHVTISSAAPGVARTAHPWLSARTVALALFAIGCLDVVLRLRSFHLLHAWNRGFEDVVNDPGKHFFHLVILPLVGAHLFKTFPTEQLGKLLAISRSFRAGAIAIGCCLAVLTAFLGGSHEKEDFYQRCTSPEDVGSSTVRSNVFVLREKYRPSQTELGTEGYKTNASIALTNFHRDRDALFKAHNIKESWSGLVSDRSLKAQVAAVESLTAAFIGAAVLWAALTFLLGRALLGNKDAPPLESIHALFCFVVAIMVWMPLKMYSEWYSNFNSAPQHPAPIIVNVVVWLFVCGLVFVGWLFTTKSIKRVYAGLSVLATIPGIAFQAKPELFVAFSAFFFKSQPFLKLSIYVAATAAAVVAMLSLARPASVSDGGNGEQNSTPAGATTKSGEDGPPSANPS